MKSVETALPGVRLLELASFGDPRGRFMETYNRDRYRACGIDLEFVQDNFSSSTRDVVRGLHYQLAHPQGKLIHVIHGAIYDVAVDIRRGSPTFGQWVGAELSEENRSQMWIPPGFAHGFVTTSEIAYVCYKVTANYVPADERAVQWDDPQLAISWPLAGPPTLSTRDRAAPPLETAELPEYEA